MTIAEILDGPMKPADAWAGFPTTEAEVRWYIHQMETHTKRKAARQAMAKLAPVYGARTGRISPEVVALYRAYAAALAA